MAQCREDGRRWTTEDDEEDDDRHKFCKGINVDDLVSGL